MFSENTTPENFKKALQVFFLFLTFQSLLTIAPPSAALLLRYRYEAYAEFVSKKSLMMGFVAGAYFHGVMFVACLIANFCLKKNAEKNTEFEFLHGVLFSMLALACVPLSGAASSATVHLGNPGRAAIVEFIGFFGSGILLNLLLFSGYKLFLFFKFFCNNSRENNVAEREPTAPIQVV